MLAGVGVAATVVSGALGWSPVVVQAGSGPAAAVQGTVFWISVAPDYRRTGLVLASVAASGCAHQCLQLWASHDGGASWHVQPAAGWAQGRFTIAATGAGDVVFAESPSGLQRSDDGGASWHDVAPPGTPTTSASFADDAVVAVASVGHGSDYMLRSSSLATVTGSGGTLVDLQFMLSPAFPKGGRFAPALVSAADSQSGAPVIERCDAALDCHGSTVLAGAGAFAIPVSLAASSSYVDDGTVFARAGRAVYKSTDGGRTFTPLTILPDRGGSVTAYPALQLAPGYSERGPVRALYVAALQANVDRTDPRGGSSGGGVLRSDDGGATWVRAGSPSPLDGGASALAVASDGRLFAGYVGGAQGTAGLLCSAGGGAWAPACPAVVTPADRAVSSSSAPVDPARSATPCGAACVAGATDNGTGVPVGNATNTTGASVTASAPAAPAHGTPLMLLILPVVAGAVLAGLRLRHLDVAARRPASGAPHASSRGRRNTPHSTAVVDDEKQASG